MKKKSSEIKERNKESARQYRLRFKAKLERFEKENAELRLKNARLEAELAKLKAEGSAFLASQWEHFFSETDSEALWNDSVPEADLAGAPSEVAPEISSDTSSPRSSETDSEVPSEAYSEVPSLGESETVSEYSSIASGFFKPIPEPVSPPLAVQPRFQLNK